MAKTWKVEKSIMSKENSLTNSNNHNIAHTQTDKTNNVLDNSNVFVLHSSYSQQHLKMQPDGTISRSYQQIHRKIMADNDVDVFGILNQRDNLYKQMQPIVEKHLAAQYKLSQISQQNKKGSIPNDGFYAEIPNNQDDLQKIIRQSNADINRLTDQISKLEKKINYQEIKHSAHITGSADETHGKKGSFDNEDIKNIEKQDQHILIQSQQIPSPQRLSVEALPSNQTLPQHHYPELPDPSRQHNNGENVSHSNQTAIPQDTTTSMAVKLSIFPVLTLLIVASYYAINYIHNTFFHQNDEVLAEQKQSNNTNIKNEEQINGMQIINSDICVDDAHMYDSGNIFIDDISISDSSNTWTDKMQTNDNSGMDVDNVPTTNSNNDNMQNNMPITIHNPSLQSLTNHNHSQQK